MAWIAAQRANFSISFPTMTALFSIQYHSPSDSRVKSIEGKMFFRVL
jgi:hypothetical protein